MGLFRRRRADEEDTALSRLGCVVKLVGLTVIVIVAVTYFQARSLILFGPSDRPFQPVEEMDALRRVGVVFMGQQHPRPKNLVNPSKFQLAFHRVEIPGTDEGPTLDAWFIPYPAPEGLALLFHDYAQSKDDLLAVAAEFHDLHYAVLMVDLRASGDTERMQREETSFGWYEANDVRRAVSSGNDFLPAGGLRVLYGLGTGGAAVMRAVSELGVPADALVVEGAFATLLEFFQHWIQQTGLPSATARLSLLWAGYSENFDARLHAPVLYAKKLKVPTLILHGTADPHGDVDVARAVHAAMAPGIGQFQAIKGAGRPIAKTHSDAWFEAVDAFLRRVPADSGPEAPGASAPSTSAPASAAPASAAPATAASAAPMTEAAPTTAAPAAPPTRALPQPDPDEELFEGEPE